jgi:hypothetical protein
VLHGDCILPARWDPDPRTNGAFDVYTPDGYSCDLQTPWRHCWPIGSSPLASADTAQKPAFHPSPHHKPRAERPALSQAAREALADVGSALRSAAAHADAARSTGSREDLTEISVNIALARQELETATTGEARDQH